MCEIASANKEGAVAEAANEVLYEKGKLIARLPEDATFHCKIVNHTNLPAKCLSNDAFNYPMPDGKQRGTHRRSHAIKRTQKLACTERCRYEYHALVTGTWSHPVLFRIEASLFVDNCVRATVIVACDVRQTDCCRSSGMQPSVSQPSIFKEEANERRTMTQIVSCFPIQFALLNGFAIHTPTSRRH